MENNQFDNEIKKLLQDMEVPFQEAHWGGLASRLHEIEEPNTPNEVTGFDQSISDKLTGFEVAFNESNWVALRSRLVAYNYLKKWILQTKTIEGLFMLFMALVMLNTSDNQPVTPAMPKFDGPIAEAPTGSPSPVRDVLAEKNIRHSTPTTKQLSGVPVAGKRKNNIAILPALTTSWVSAKDENMDVRSSFAQASREVSQEVAVSNPSVMYLTLLNALPNLNPEKLNTAHSFKMPKVAYGQKEIPSIGFAVYGILNADRIITGMDPATKINVPDLWSPGYGGGVEVSKDLGAYSLAVGIEYQEVKYFPKPVVRVVEGSVDIGYVGAGTSTVELERLNLPVTATYKLISRPKHRLTAELGLVGGWGKESFQQSTFIMGHKNQVDEKVLRKELDEYGEQPSVYVTTPNQEPISQSPKYQQKSKFFASARASLGYEYRIDTQHALFAKATYTHQLSKIGVGLPNDHLNSVGLHFGSRVYL